MRLAKREQLLVDAITETRSPSFDPDGQSVKHAERQSRRSFHRAKPASFTNGKSSPKCQVKTVGLLETSMRFQCLPKTISFALFNNSPRGAGAPGLLILIPMGAELHRDETTIPCPSF